MKPFTLLTMLGVGLGLGGPALAWGPEGHTVIARVGTSGLNARAQADLDWIIAVGTPALNARMQQQFGPKCQIDPKAPFGPVPDYHTDNNQHANYATWADCYRAVTHTTVGWHFNDIPLGQTPTRPLNTAAQAWCAAPDLCVSIALANNIKALAASPTAPADAAQAFAYVVHFVGDLHQPLHEEDNNDRGGNQVAITAADPRAGGAANLHALWDEPLVAVALGSGDLDKAAAALSVITVKIPAPVYPDTQAAIADTDQWVLDAHALAEPAYALLHIPIGAGPRKPIPIDTAYLDTEGPVVRNQLAQAAVRLRAVLDIALTWTPPAAP